MDAEQLDPIEKPSGDTLVQEITVYDADSDTTELKELVSAEVTWALLDRSDGDVVIDDADDDVAVALDEQNSVVTVELTGATADYEGLYTQRLRITDVDGKRRTYTGAVKLTDLG